MSRARHKKAMGGEAEPKPYNAQGSNVEKEAEERKHGGRAKRARGGNIMLDHDETAMKQKRLDRPGRKRGGGVGSDKTPLTSAARTTGPANLDVEKESEAED